MNIPSYKKRKNAAYIAFSPEFKKRVKTIRSELGIPPKGFPLEEYKLLGSAKKGLPQKDYFYPQETVGRWYAEHVKKSLGNVQYKDLPQYYWYFPQDIAELLEKHNYSGEPCMAGFHPEVPLDRYAMDLIREFNLPEDLVNEVKKRILVEENSGFGVSSKLQPITISMNSQDGPYVCVLIAGIDGSTTKKEWLDLWQEISTQLQSNGIELEPVKRDEEKIEIRDLIWWKWRTQGLKIGEIADKWEADHDGEAYSEDTVNVAIKRVNEIMSPGEES
jgi:hypothetical protein